MHPNGFEHSMRQQSKSFYMCFCTHGFNKRVELFFFYLMCGCVFVFVLRFGFVSLFQFKCCFFFILLKKKLCFYVHFPFSVSVCGCCMCNNNYWTLFRSPCNLISIFQQYTLFFNIYIISQLHDNQFNGNG